MVERESLDIDVLFVGAGPASLSGALHLAQLIKAHNQREGVVPLSVSIAVIEKGKEVGAHTLSGAVLDPKALKELIPDFLQRGAPLDTPVEEDHVWFLTEKWKWASPIIPPPMHNQGNYVISLGQIVKWLAKQAEEAGVDILPEFPGAELIYDGPRIAGVRTGDKGIDKDGKPKPNYEPGIDIHTKVVVLGEGVRGSLTKQLINRLRLDAGKNPQVYSIGVKELWEVPDGRLPAGTVIHTLGFPLDTKTFGGGFIYAMKGNLVSIGLVVGLDYQDPRLDPHREFQRFKTHPAIFPVLSGGTLVRYGAKALPEGGYYATPRLWADGVLVIGDAGSLLNAQRLKGIHLAMKSGMLAAESVFQALLAGDFSANQLSRYETLLRQSWVEQELYKVRNFHQSFDHGLWFGLFNGVLQLVTGGRGLKDPMPSRPGHERMKLLSTSDSARATHHPGIKFDGRVTFDKLTDVYYARTAHEENQPCHLIVQNLEICHTRCTVEYGNPCQRFCPANVYEMVEAGEGQRRLQINASNCVHCKTCDIMDPYQIITWVPPEGGGGPDWVKM
jgi:electron-transferring-flavoprotein dehydrogenase